MQCVRAGRVLHKISGENTNDRYETLLVNELEGYAHFQAIMQVTYL